MQRSPSFTTVDRSFSMVGGVRGDRPAAASTELNLTGLQVAKDPAEIFRRLDRRPAPRPVWMTAVAIAVLALAATGGVIAYQGALGPIASHTQFLTPGSVSRS